MNSSNCFGKASQKTLAQAFSRTGVGLHSGLEVQVTVRPAPGDTGRYFVRGDRPNLPKIPATIAQVQGTVLSTELVAGEARVRTVEHLLAALVGMGVTNAEIEVNGPEVPLLDGSAQEWVGAIVQAGLVEQSGFVNPVILTEPLWVQEGDAFVVGFPAQQTRFSYEIDFPQLPPIGCQQFSFDFTTNDFAEAIAPARTFGFAEQVDQLRSQGLIQGGSLENALVCDRDRWLNPPLRFANEPVRHKLLDLIGDLSLLGVLPVAHILAYKASHKLHTAFAQGLAQRLAFSTE